MDKEKLGITWEELKDKVFPIYVTVNEKFEDYEVYIPAEFGGGSYDIPFEQMKCEQELLLWIKQLSQKRWCRGEMIAALIDNVYQVWGKNLYGN